MIGKVREQIAGERITEFLSGMSQLGFTEQDIVALLEKQKWGGEEQWITMNWLSVRGLTKNYGKKTALNNLNLTLGRGQFIGLLGPNGSGKTTTIKLLNGLLQPTSGSVLIDGQAPGTYTHSIISYLPDKTISTMR